ncbi:MAG: XdhC family protein [Acetobacteraceae bacterium]|nr:XdhC family protein [Acetobacteraceae bacterium]
MTPEIRAEVTAARSSKRPFVLATRLSDGAQALIFADHTDAALHPALLAAAQDALAADHSGTVEVEGERWFLHVQNPPLRLVVVGAVHVAQALVPLAADLGYSVRVIDPRGAFATAERFPNVSVSTGWPDEAMAEFAPDARSAVVTLTHDPKLDDPALDAALKSSAFYIGALGSRKTHAARLARLRELGHAEATLARIRGPIGLDIGAETAPEIALSILAEIVAVRRQAAIALKAAA